MGENSILSTIIHSFPPTAKEHWKQAASSEISGEDPFKILSWKSADGLNFFPYYDRYDTAKLNSSAGFDLPVAENSFLGPRRWLCAPYVKVRDETEANKISLDHLASGADGIFLDLRSLTSVSCESLLNGIEWQYCHLFFHINKPHAVELRKYISGEAPPLSKLNGALFWETIPKKTDVDYYLEHTTNIKSLGMIIPSRTPAREIADALTRTVRLIESLDVKHQELRSIFNAIAFSLSADVHFFETVCKLKALRWLLFQLFRSYGLEDHKPEVHLHVRSEPWTDKNYQPHANMIKSTAAAMASVLGGCDSLTIIPEEENNSTMSRAARNVSSVLREESHLNKVADPLAGAYALEVMTDELAKQAWALLQSEMR